MLTKLFSPALLDTVFDRAADSLPCPPAADRAFWESLAERPPRNAWKEELLHRAEAAVAAPETLWPQLRAFQAFRFVRDGNRTDYETIYFQRRFHFSLLVLAECLEYRGRFLPEVVEGLWALLSEPFWYVPAHAHYRLPDPMPRYDSPQIDLFAAETAMLLADAVRLLGPELEAVSPELLRWIREEVRRRVFAPLEREGEDAPWWFAGRNNWTPWCSANTLGALFTFEEVRQNKCIGIGRRNRNAPFFRQVGFMLFFVHGEEKFLLNLLKHAAVLIAFDEHFHFFKALENVAGLQNVANLFNRA